ncbi:MAG: UbiX family flavin prenyltransferase, partial [Candidatus Hadarchaeum sp.]
MRLVIAITGASGALYGLRFLEACQRLGIETELIVSKSAEKILMLELGKTAADLRRLATRSYSPDDLEAPPSSGSYPVDGMVVIPCSMKTLGEIANGISQDLIARAADVALKQNRMLVLVPRE